MYADCIVFCFDSAGCGFKDITDDTKTRGSIGSVDLSVLSVVARRIRGDRVLLLLAHYTLVRDCGLERLFLGLWRRWPT